MLLGEDTFGSEFQDIVYILHSIKKNSLDPEKIIKIENMK